MSSFDPVHVLVVDDEELNRKLLRLALSAQGHQVIEASDGEEALALAAQNPPDVVLLDVMMPGLDGYDTCRRLKEAPATAPVPVIMMTARQDRPARLQGIDAGANDFLTKPIDVEDMVLRVRNASRAKRLYDELQEKNRRLEALEELRDTMTHMIVHDLRSPLAGAMGYMELLRWQTRGRLSEQEQTYLDSVLGSAALLNEMLSSILDVSRMEAGRMPLERSACVLAALAREAADGLGFLAARNPVRIESPEVPLVADCDPQIVRRVLQNLIANAAHFSPEGAEIVVRVSGPWRQREGDPPGWMRVEVLDRGAGVPPEDVERIFEKFGQAAPCRRPEGHPGSRDRTKHSTGLGLTFCRLAVEAHGGAIGVRSEPGQGSSFWFTLPTYSPPGECD